MKDLKVDLFLMKEYNFLPSYRLFIDDNPAFNTDHTMIYNGLTYDWLSIVDENLILMSNSLSDVQNTEEYYDENILDQVEVISVDNIRKVYFFKN